jgi:guanylate kinase
MTELEQRLRSRGTDSDDSISKRLFKVSFEMSFERQFDVTLVNKDLEDTLEQAKKLVDEFVAR